jgi:ketosteroid isomerase-like protein
LDVTPIADDGEATMMSHQNVEIIRRSQEEFQTTGQPDADLMTPDFVWDMSNFVGWPEQQVYEGVEGTLSFLGNWTAAWDDWELEVDALHDAGDRVVAVMRQRGRSKATGMPVEMSFAMVWTLRDGKHARMEMYSDPGEALKAVGLER